ncbi:hypothetical protein BS329_15425 [Amycolatopsis coloradensis]|uniref:Uncharacterized protein n=1 Tax=Amycolatopsis coloradensis TaxID=76021 RepID=A0A1R0KU92_9PSEU|nr:hypothetical protein [Amycolatopsis coloradensis]OLZ51655.1 hypothetical protein BS329_15425 [Amycolatopsis coloradensis]
MRTKHTDGWAEAVELEHDLALGVEPEAITPPPTLPTGRDDGERVLAEFSRARQVHLRYERFESRDVLHVPDGPSFVVGSPGFVATAIVGTALRRARQRGKARAMAAPQWHEHNLDVTVVTTHRLWCHVDGIWANFNFDEISGVELTASIPALTLAFRSTTPLRISGKWAPWIAVASAYGAFGHQARQLPALAPLRSASRTATAATTDAAVHVRDRGRR